MNVTFIRNTTLVSGAEKYNVYLHLGLKRFGDIKSLFLSNNQEFLQLLKRSGADVELLNIPIAEIGTKRELIFFLLISPLYILEYVRIFAKFKGVWENGVVCLESMTEKIFLTFPLRLMGSRVVWIEHGPLFSSRRSLVIKLLYRLASLQANRIIAVSSHCRVDLIAGGVQEKIVTTMYIGIDTREYAPLKRDSKKELRRRLKFPETGLVIGYIGTLNEEKGIDEFMRVALDISKKFTNVSFLVVGDGPLEPWARNFTQSHGLDSRLKFTGKVNAVKQYMQLLDIFMFPTRCLEGISLVLLEAASVECLAVAADTGGGNKEVIINRKTGILYKSREPSDICSILEDLIIHYPDPTLVKIRKEARRRILKTFNMYLQANKFRKLFLSL